MNITDNGEKFDYRWSITFNANSAIKAMQIVRYIKENSDSCKFDEKYLNFKTEEDLTLFLLKFS